MKRIKFIILLFVISNIALAHEDTYYQYNYDNVIVRFKTGNYYEEIENAKIIGKYASMLCKTMDYSNPVLLDFIHDYGNFYEGDNYSFIDYGYDSYEIVSYWIPMFDTAFYQEVYHPIDYKNTELLKDEKVEQDVYTIPIIDKSKKVIVRQFGFNFDIETTINMLHYALSSIDIIKSEIIPDTLNSYNPNTFYALNTIPTYTIDSIMHNTTKMVEKTLESKVYKEIDSISYSSLYYSYYSKDNKYFVYAGIHNKEILLDTLNHIFSFEITPYYSKHLFVFETQQKMRVYKEFGWNDEFECLQSHNIPVKQFEYISSIRIERIGDDIFMINYNNVSFFSPFKRFIYLANDDVLITDFESYIDSYRKKDQ